MIDNRRPFFITRNCYFLVSNQQTINLIKLLIYFVESLPFCLPALIADEKNIDGFNARIKERQNGNI